MLQCQLCHRTFEITRKIPWCDCGGLFDTTYFPRTLITLGEPVTPIIPIHAAGRTVAAKLEYLLPTGSFKDRGAKVLVSAMKELGVPRFMEDSSGNAAAAMSAYAARAGILCEIYCPSTASPTKLVQVQRTGATIHRIDGPRDNTTATVMEQAGKIFYASHNWHPLFLHGTKSMAYEILDQYNGQPPRHIVAPTGGGAVLLGLHLGFTELITSGKMSSMPKLHAVQAEACAPLVHEQVTARPSIAEGILTARPPRLPMLKRVVDSVTVVSEEEIIDGFRSLGRQGINAEPTSAVVVPALKKLSVPLNDLNESILVILTGSGLKSAFL